MTNESPKKPVAASKPSASTGPRTEAGKAISSQNARKRDLCSRTLNLTPEEWDEYNDMGERYRRDLQPANDIEQTLIDETCFNYWRLQQAREAELHIIANNPLGLPLIALYIRYRTGYERGYYKALDKLQQTQRIRKQEAASLDRLRSAKSQTPPALRVRSEAPLAAIPRTTHDIAGAALQFQDDLETHLRENKVRAELALSPLEMPKKLAAQFDDFVSQNPGALPQSLLESFRKAA
jgi:hypothetical protein